MLIEDILKKKKPVKEEVKPIPVQAKPIEINESVNAAASPTSVQTIAQAEAIPPSYAKPAGMADDDYLHLRKFYSDEQIAKTYAPYDPNKNENFWERLYTSSSQKPELDEQRLRNMRTMGAIGDSVRLLGQMYAAGKGAMIQPNKDSLTDYFANKEDKERNRYLELLDRYDKGLGDARGRDFLRGLQEYDNNRKGMQKALSDREQLKLKERKDERDWQYKLDKDKRTQENEDRKFKGTEDHRRTMEKQGWARIQKSGSGGSGSEKQSGIEFVLKANPRDKDASTDSFGNKVQKINLSKGEVDYALREALSDKVFLKNNPQYDRKPNIFGGAPKPFTDKERVDIVATWMKEQYDAQFPESFTETGLPWENMPSRPWQQYLPGSKGKWETESDPEIDKNIHKLTREDILGDNDPDEMFPIIQ